VSIPTLKRAEAGGSVKVAEDTMAAIAKALEKAGVEFIAENGGGGEDEEASGQNPVRHRLNRRTPFRQFVKYFPRKP
jgi:hypothetical protein